MILTAALLACAVNIHPVTTKAVISVESGFDPLALNINGWAGPKPHPSSVEDAARIARSFIDRGYRVDIGPMQIDSDNLRKLGVTVEQVLDPCKNLEVGATILQGDYARAVALFGEGQYALRVALSLYNTGKLWLGFANGYVARYYGRLTVPALTIATEPRARPSPPAIPAVLRPYNAGTAVYTRVALNVGVQ